MQVLAPELANKLSFDEVRALRRMPTFVGKAWLKSQRSDLEESEVQQIIETLCVAQHVPDKQTGGNYDPHRKKFLAVAWIMGASSGQLSSMFRIAKQTVFASIDREIDKETRNAVRLRDGLEQWKLEGVRDNYYKLIAKDSRVFDGMSAPTIALVLDRLPLSTSPDEPESDDPYTQFAAPKVKLG